MLYEHFTSLYVMGILIIIILVRMRILLIVGAVVISTVL